MKILQIVYHYPPMGGAGVQRGLKFSKYLPQFGIVPVVLAGADPHYVQDASLLDEVPAGVEVHRVAHTPWLARLAARRRGAATPAAAGVAARERTAPAGPPATAAARGRGATGPWRDAVLRGVQSLQWPDDAGPWARRALPRARALLAAHAAAGAPVRLLLSSAPPVAAHALAARLAAEHRLPWVADWRDLWTGNPGYAAPGWRRGIDRRAEARWLASATGIVTVTPSWARRFADACGGRPVAFVPNGYDEADFAALAPAPRDGPAAFTLVHAGTFYGHQSPLPVLDGIAAYRRRAGAAALRLRLVGQTGSRFDPALAAFDAAHPGVLQRLDYRPHRQALAELLAADALLLVVGGGAAAAGVLPGKLFEYLRAARPVLLLGPVDGDAAALVRRHAPAAVVDGADPERTADAIDALVRGAVPPPPERDVAAYERRALAGRLADFLRGCAAAG